MHIHLVSNSIYVNSGFGKVARYIGMGLKKLGHEVSVTGLQTIHRVDHDYGIDCYPLETGGHVDEATQLFLNLQNLKPDVLFFVGQMDADTNHLVKVFDKQIIYCPVEGRNIPDQMTNDLKDVIRRGGKIVAQCSYGLEEMRKAGVNADRYIYHGIDPNVFYPISDDMINDNLELITDEVEIVSILKWDNADKRWIQKNVDILKLVDEIQGGINGRGKNNRFIYQFTGQNFGLRKQIPRLLKAYSLLINVSKQMKDRTVLAMHTLPISISGVNLIRNIHRLGIQDNVIFTYSSFGSSGWSENAMNIWYNLADVNVSASSSEGWGLPTGESMACGIPNIGPNCSSFIELIGDDKDEFNKNRGWLANIATYHQIQDGSERALVDEMDIALKLKIAYVEKDKMKMFSENGIEFMKNYTWDKICLQWNDLLKEMA